MVTLEEDANSLVNFGFTYNQAKIYAAITRLHAASVGSISKMAKVRREHVYRTLPKLEKMGLIEKVLGTPEKIKAISVEQALSILVKKQQDEAQRKISTLMDEAKTFLKRFKQRDLRSVVDEDESQFSLLSEKDAIMSKTAAIIENAQAEILMTTSRKKLAKFIFFFADLLKKATRRGVRIQVITEMPEDGDPLPRVIEEQISPGTALELKYSSDLPSHYLVADKTQVMICASAEGDFAERPCLCTNSSSLLALTQRSFTNVWHASINWTKTTATAVSRRLAVPRS